MKKRSFFQPLTEKKAVNAIRIVCVKNKKRHYDDDSGCQALKREWKIKLWRSASSPSSSLDESVALWSVTEMRTTLEKNPDSTSLVVMAFGSYFNHGIKKAKKGGAWEVGNAFAIGI
ncbi:hypothetical protein E2542_SST05038 [Spatholobus suberectus]|nr:hypothetical protein E2542_SST05038 [Spatholobus suberectus]